jgi:hypothetical protein
LVFARARTSAFHSILFWDTCQELAKRLNSVLADVDASYFRIELVRRGDAQFFITSTFSPRFNWSRKLTHREVGRNLDFYAAGHIMRPPFPPRRSLIIFEKHLICSLTVEMAILSALEEKNLENELVQFNDSKESLFNETMQKLGLSYLFKWLLNTSAAKDAVTAVMIDSPPAKEWWDKYCFLVNGFGYESLAQRPCPFCSCESNYVLWWPLIQYTFHFIMK